MALLMVAGGASAEDWTLLWSEDFCSSAGWTVAANHVIAPASCDLEAIPGGWFGPTYMTTGTWDPATQGILKIHVENLQATGSGADNTQLAMSVDADHRTVDATGNDFLELRLVGCGSCGPDYSWTVLWKDDGGSLHTTTHPLAGDWRAFRMDANITLNVPLLRYWINYTVQGGSDTGSFTGLWTNDVDGPFAESSAFFLNFWTYASAGNWYVGETNAGEDVGLYWAEAPEIPPPPPPPPPPRKHVHADFGWTEGELGTQFYDRSVGDGEMVAWNWSFGDGYGSRRANPFHTYMCRGNYTVILEVEDIYGERGTVSATYRENITRPLCGVITRGEEGIQIDTGERLITVPTAVFLITAVLSASSLAMGFEIPFVPRWIRWLLLMVSVLGLMVTFGFIGSIGTLLRGG